MASSLQQRVAARGYPVWNQSGQTGQGALPDSTLPSGQVPGSPTATWANPNNDPASVPAALPVPESYMLGTVMWGLPGAPNPDNTPRTHAAPFADPTLPIPEYNAELEAVHAPEFNGVYLRDHPPTLTRFPFGQQLVQGGGGTNLQPLPPSMRAMGGLDAVQGFGGGGTGPGGVNGDMPLTVLDRQFPGQTYTTFLNAAEVPLLTTDAVQFIAVEPSLPPWQPTYVAPTTSVLAQDTVVADTPAQGPAVPAAGGGLLPSWGSLGG